MLTGRNPATGERLLGRQGVPGKGAVPGFDLTFAVPKSVFAPSSGKAVLASIAP
jgi:hypothetical protein